MNVYNSYGNKIAGPFYSFDATEGWLTRNGWERFEGSNRTWRKGNNFAKIKED